MRVSDFIKRYEVYCPKEFSMEGDLVGLQIGSLNKEVKKVLFTLDIREQTVVEAIEKEVDLVIVKHAPIFRPLKDLVADNLQNRMCLELVKHDIAVYVSHTNIDVVEDGLNDWFCELLEMKETTYLTETGPNRGIGRVGQIKEQTVAQFAKKVKTVFDLDTIRLISYGDDETRMISRVAICGGSGGSFYKDAVEKGAEVYITGDIYYHTAQEMLTEGLLALDPGHYIEVLFAERLVQKCNEWKKEEGWDVEFLVSQTSTDPFQFL